jgi:NitT/TauT family transport system substrate-binding protein
MRIAVPDLVANSYFPALAAEELRFYAAEGMEAHVELLAPAPRGDLQAMQGLYIGAAPGPDAALRSLLTDEGLDLARDDIRIGPVPGVDAPGTSFGVLAA